MLVGSALEIERRSWRNDLQQQIIEYGRNTDKRGAELSFWDAAIVLQMARILDPALTMTDSHLNVGRP